MSNSEKKYQMILNSIMKEVDKKQASSSSSHDVTLENYTILVMCRYPAMGPSSIVKELARFDLYTDIDEVIRILRSDYFFLGNPKNRKIFFERINKLAETLKDIMQDCENPEKLKVLESIRIQDYIIDKEKARKQYIHKMILIALFDSIEELRNSDSFQYILESFGKTYCIHLIGAVFSTIRKISALNANADAEQPSGEQEKYEELQEENARLNEMLAELHDEFTERLAVAKQQELTEFFSMLNSEKYCYIMDELFLLRKGFNTLRKNGYQPPAEISGIAVVMNRFMQFIKDSGISPMIPPETIQEVRMENIDDYQYEGSAFEDSQQVKKVMVVSSGWCWKEKNIIISRPKVREIEADS